MHLRIMQSQLFFSRNAKVKNARRFPVWSARCMWTSFKTSWGIPLIWPSWKPCVSSSSLFTPLMTSVVCTHQVDAILENTHWTLVCELIYLFLSYEINSYGHLGCVHTWFPSMVPEYDSRWALMWKHPLSSIDARIRSTRSRPCIPAPW